MGNLNYLAKNGTLLEVLKILEATENLKFCGLNYHRMRKCKTASEKVM